MSFFKLFSGDDASAANKNATPEDTIKELNHQLRLAQNNLAARGEEVQALKALIREKDQELNKWKDEAFSQVTDQTPAFTSGMSAHELEDHPHFKGSVGSLRDQNKRLGEEIRTLQAQLTAANEKYAALETTKNSEISVLTKDRIVLYEEVRSLTDAKTALEKTNQENAETIEQMSGFIKNLQEQLDAAANVVMASRTTANERTDLVIQEKFSLPDTEICVQYYSCMDSWMTSGWLYITPNYLCWENSIKLLKERKVVIAIRDIYTLNKLQPMLRVGSGLCLEIVLKDKTKHIFKGLIHRGDTVRTIVKQAEVLKVPLIVTKNGVVEEEYVA